MYCWTTNVLLQGCIFFVFLLVFCWRVKMTNTSSSSLRSFHIYRKWMEGGNVRFSMKRKIQCSRIEFWMNLAQLFILSYLTTPWMMFAFKNCCALFCFISTIDEHNDTVHLIEGCFLMKQSHIREWEDNNRLINFKWALVRGKKPREIQDTRQRHKL